MDQPQFRRVSVDVSVAPQLTPEAMALVRQAGFNSVVNNRPDFEEGPGQPTTAALETAAKAQGLQYVYLPVSGSYQSPEDVAKFGELLQTLPKPILAFCRSGARSTRLFTLAQQLL
jgi:uncharacterized protein (TIGR01244 family)